MSIALHIIVKDELEQVRNILTKYARYFDEIVIAVDYKYEEFLELKKVFTALSVYKYEWINDFSHKRNFLVDKISSEFYFRMDTDDDIENPHIIAEIVKAMQEHGCDVYHTPYIYAVDDKGICIAKHWRETIIRKKPGIYWKKSIHENIFLDNPNDVKTLRDDRLKIIHNIDEAHAKSSYERNIKYLVDEFEKDWPDNTDPRTIAYIGRMLMAKAKWAEAILFLENLTKRSGWDDDKYFAWIQMSQCYQQLGKFDLALMCCNEALGINTKFPDAYLQMGAIYINKQDYQKAVDWIMPGIVRPEPDTVMVIDPSFYTYKAKINAALALLGKGDTEMALNYFNEAKKIAPSDQYILGLEPMFVDAYENDKYLKNLTWMIQYTQRKDSKKVDNLIDAMPKNVFVDERACALRNNFSKPKTWLDKEVVIFCGQAWEDWAPPSVLKGIGGSEEAVIYLSKELVKIGYSVTVFNSCGDMAGEYEGVVYKPYYEFNLNDNYSTVISWRQNFFTSLKAKRKIIWLHDVPGEGMFTEETVKYFDKVIVLSDFHKSLLPKCVPEEKIFISSNGINIEDFQVNGVFRNNKRAIYTSSYDRGLQHLLEIWPDVRKEVPDAQLDIYYGWDTYDKMMATGARPASFKNAMVQLMNQPGITEHGRIGHKQLVKEFKKSGVWAYPSHFEEISCISAMKAQASGCVPVCTDYAALKETVKAGIKVEGRCSDAEVKQKFKESLIEIFKDEKRQDVLRTEVLKHKEEFGWDKVAKNWAESIL